MTRAQVLNEIVVSPKVEQRFFNESFVAMQYFGYLGYRDYIGDVTNQHCLTFDLVKPLTHLRASRRPRLDSK